MTTPDRPQGYFVGDASSIDFLNTRAVTNGLESEWIAHGDDLLDWLVTADLVPEDVLRNFRATALPGEMDAVAAKARAIREWFRRFVERHRGNPLSPGILPEIEPLNRILAQDKEFGQIALQPGMVDRQSSTGFRWSPQRQWLSTDALLFPIARAMAELICNDDFSYIRICEGVGCELLFMDRTRLRNRRWCSMSLCGNRAKQIAHRLRHHQVG